MSEAVIAADGRWTMDVLKESLGTVVRWRIYGPHWNGMFISEWEKVARKVFDLRVEHGSDEKLCGWCGMATVKDCPVHDGYFIGEAWSEPSSDQLAELGTDGVTMSSSHMVARENHWELTRVEQGDGQPDLWIVHGNDDGDDLSYETEDRVTAGVMFVEVVDCDGGEVKCRYCGSADISVGSGCSRRTHTGYWVNERWEDPSPGDRTYLQSLRDQTGWPYKASLEDWLRDKGRKEPVSAVHAVEALEEAVKMVDDARVRTPAGSPTCDRLGRMRGYLLDNMRLEMLERELLSRK